MFQRRTIFNAIELGSSKIAVWIGEQSEDGSITILGMGMVDSAGAIVKGEIFDMGRAASLLDTAIKQADKASGNRFTDALMTLVLVTGCNISSQNGVGTSFVKNAEGVVTEEERVEAIENARIGCNCSSDRRLINSTVIGYSVNGRQVPNPLGQKGSSLEARVHVVSGVSSRLDNFSSLVYKCGFDGKIELVYAPLAASCGIISEKERHEGVLLVDLGAGCTDYLVDYDTGACGSGTLLVGIEHLANDLSLGLNLHIDICRKLLEKGIIEAAREQKQDFLEFPSSTGKARRIPLESFEQIMEVRLRETFEIIRQNLEKQDKAFKYAKQGILTGGGANLKMAREIFSEVFQLPCQIGKVADAHGAVTGADDPRFSAIWGCLKVGGYYTKVQDNHQQVGNVINHLAGAWNQAGKSLRLLKEVIKF